MNTVIIDIIKGVSKISDAAEKELESMISSKFIRKGTYLLKEGEVCSHIYFIHFGFAHQFKWKKKDKISNFFWSNNDFVAHMISFLTQTPCRENIEILEDSKVYAISYVDLQYMYKEYPEFNHFGRLMLEKYFLEMANLGELSKVRPARKRYEILAQKQPHLLQLATSGQIASYLNMSQETLSRIRAKQE
ncbi:Crp/Fnr family transcriptional regulator [Costertonia aggregata]|uniref:Crp/Fnr family transcriptional regulator n=1 Tax=Costertonia aggregata TaxID=343403 RepID=A0A7H9AMV0_9FLAO|nr:Crp/Fnr family transcriptional regulator [Costertonia aggregata]QLG44770.1 Crp/Fnr family transcriptional regulator [Costertonia aggregata]